MRLRRLDQKLLAGIVGLFLLPGILAAGTLVALYRWGAFGDAFTLLVTVVAGLAAMMGYLGLIAHTIGQNLVRAIRQMQLETEVMATVNPAYRLDISSGDELQGLAEEINHLADRLIEARRAGARSVAGAAGGREPEGQRISGGPDTPPAVEGSAGFAGGAGRVSVAGRARPAGRAPAADPAGPVPSKPLPLYDFSVLDDVDRHVAPVDRDRPLEELVCTVLDAETTGLAPSRGDRIVSVACVRVRNGSVRRTEVLDVLVHPGRSIPPESTLIHGITDEMVAGAPSIETVVPDLVRFADGTVIVGHQVWFDLMFLRAATDRLGVPPLTLSHPVLDTWLLSQFLHGPLGGHDLEVVAVRLGVPPHGRHSARGDALMTAEILVRLCAILRRRGIGTLGEALDAMRRTRARFRAAAGAP